jgi:hypothetical protein
MRHWIAGAIGWLGILLALGNTAASAQEAVLPSSLKVVVNKDTTVSSLEADDLARIYLGKRTLWQTGERIEPAIADDRLATTFMEMTLRRSVSQYQAHWKRLLFSGGGTPPRTFRTSAAVAEFVASEAGAIGVVDASLSDDRVKVVLVKQ